MIPAINHARRVLRFREKALHTYVPYGVAVTMGLAAAGPVGAVFTTAMLWTLRRLS
jgi:hypothetical protein